MCNPVFITNFLNFIFLCFKESYFYQNYYCQCPVARYVILISGLKFLIYKGNPELGTSVDCWKEFADLLPMYHCILFLNLAF